MIEVCCLPPMASLGTNGLGALYSKSRIANSVLIRRVDVERARDRLLPPSTLLPVELRKRRTLTMTTTGPRASGKAACLRLFVFFFAAVLAAGGVVYGQDGNGKPEEALLKNLQFRAIGPANMGGRIDDFAVVENSPSIFYVGVGTGGVWKTTNGGQLSPIFDDADWVGWRCRGRFFRPKHRVGRTGPNNLKLPLGVTECTLVDGGRQANWDSGTKHIGR